MDTGLFFTEGNGDKEAVRQVSSEAEFFTRRCGDGMDATNRGAGCFLQEGTERTEHLGRPFFKASSFVPLAPDYSGHEGAD